MLWFLIACTVNEKQRETCGDAATYLTEKVWPIISNDCASCHHSDGEARNTFFLLEGTQATEQNLAAVRELAQQKLPNTGQYLMEQKAQGFLNHGGGMRFASYQEEYEILSTYLQLENTGACPEECTDPEARRIQQSLQRLQPEQLENTIYAVFNLEVTYPKRYIQEAQSWHTEYDGEELRSIRDLARQISLTLTTNMDSYNDCEEDDSCMQSWFFDRAKVLLRGPMTTQEQDSYRQIIESQEGVQGFQLALEVLLQSPQFLYMGNRDQDYDLAERIAYFLWDAPPDQALLIAAQSGSISRALGSIVDQMLEDPRCAKKFARVNQDWLGAAKVLGRYKDPLAFPNFDAAHAESLRMELQLFSEHVWQEDAMMATLLRSSQGYANTHIESLYGLTERAQGVDDWVQQDFPEAQRAGILSRGAVAASHTVALHPSIPHRGHMLARRLLCLSFGIAPNNFEMDSILPNTFSGESAQELAAFHREQAVCNSCHSVLDPFGLALEHYDAIGQYRSEIADSSIDPSGQIPQLNMSFGDLSTLQESLLQEPLFYACYTQTWMRHAQQSILGTQEQCTVDEIADEFTQHGDVKKLLKSIVQSSVFINREAP